MVKHLYLDVAALQASREPGGGAINSPFKHAYLHVCHVTVSDENNSLYILKYPTYQAQSFLGVSVPTSLSSRELLGGLWGEVAIGFPWRLLDEAERLLYGSVMPDLTQPCWERPPQLRQGPRPVPTASCPPEAALAFSRLKRGSVFLPHVADTCAVGTRAALWALLWTVPA